MSSNIQSPDVHAATSIRRGISLIWKLALLFAVLNGLFVLRRAPILHRESDTPDERAAQAAAIWLRQQPTGARLLLLRSRKDIGAVWFNYRLNYLIYPRRHDSAWETLPPNALRNYDLLLSLGVARKAVPAGWPPLRQTDFATLSAPAMYGPSGSDSRPFQPASFRALGIAAGMIALAAVIAFGVLLLGWTAPKAPFAEWWANLAVAHLIGATALTWLVTVTAMTTGKLPVWPVYVALLALAPGARRARTRIFGACGPAGTGHPQEAEAPRAAPDPKSPAGSAIQATAAKGSQLAARWRFALLAVIGLGMAMWIVNAWQLGVGWDGYSIWQFKAQAFVQDGDLSILRDPRYADYTHPDYPLLVSLQTWWVGVHAGGYREVWAQTVGFLFALDLLVLFTAFARRWVSREHLLAGVALLVTLPALTSHAVSGFADIEMACWLLALALFLSRVAVSGERDLWPVLAWMFAGIVLVKNEGLMAAVAGLMVLLVYPGKSRSVNNSSVQGADKSEGDAGRASTALGTPDTDLRGDVSVMPPGQKLADLGRYVAAAGAAYLPWLAIKRIWHLNNDLLEGGRNPHFTIGLLIWRLETAMRGFALCLAQTGPRAGGWGLLAVLLPIGLVETIRRRVMICVPLWLLCAFQLIGYVLIYLITPWPLLAHLASSVDRLTLHLVPTLILAALIGTFADLTSPPLPQPPAPKFEGQGGRSGEEP